MIEMISPILYGLSVAAAAAAFGYLWNGRVTADYRMRVRRRMNRIESDESLAHLFVEFFDRVFDPTAKGRPRLKRAVLASCIVLALFLISISLTWWGDPNSAFGRILDQNEYPGWSGILTALAFAIGTNLFGDIFSLWETRIILGVMARSRRRIHGLLLVVDFIATTLIFIAGLGLGACISLLSEWLLLQSTSIEELLRPGYAFGWIKKTYFETYESLIVNKGILFLADRNSYDLFGVYYYTALATSVWAWLFFVGIKVWPLMAFVKRILDDEQAPVGVAMTVGGLYFGSVVTISIYGINAMSLIHTLI